VAAAAAAGLAWKTLAVVGLLSVRALPILGLMAREAAETAMAAMAASMEQVTVMAKVEVVWREDVAADPPRTQRTRRTEADSRFRRGHPSFRTSFHIGRGLAVVQAVATSTWGNRRKIPLWVQNMFLERLPCHAPCRRARGHGPYLRAMVPGAWSG